MNLNAKVDQKAGFPFENLVKLLHKIEASNSFETK